MNTALDMAIATLIGGLLLLILLNLNSRVTQEAQRSYIETYPEVEAFAIKEILDYEIPKIGYGLIWPQRAIQIAEETRLRFAYDSSRYGNFDSIVVEYHALPPIFGDTSTTRTLLQVRRRIYRPTSILDQALGNNITAFRFEYFDVNGAEIPAPVPQAQLARIKMVRVTYTTESPWRTDRRVTAGGLYTEIYPYQQITKIYRPRNLR
ncbi:MAG: hypothetical protein N2450_07435 [bacterium]|nr:hypothetical protein [bacterium]